MAKNNLLQSRINRAPSPKLDVEKKEIHTEKKLPQKDRKKKVSDNASDNKKTKKKLSFYKNNHAEKETKPKKKKSEAALRLQKNIPSPQKDGNVETEQERVQRLYMNPTLGVAGTLPKIKEEDEESYEKELEIKNDENIAKAYRSDKYSRIFTKVGSICLIIFSFYLVFLIYGVVMTNYEYNGAGKVVPCVMSVSDIRDKKEFDSFLSYYEEARNIYEQIYMIDYRLSLNQEDPLVLAPEYEAILEQISGVSSGLNAAEFSSRYTVVQSLLLDWIMNQSALYVQNMASAISTNNSESADAALQYRSNMMISFTSITDNLLAIGRSLKGVYVDDIESWNIDDYLYQQIYGKE